MVAIQMADSKNSALVLLHFLDLRDNRNFKKFMDLFLQFFSFGQNKNMVVLVQLKNDGSATLIIQLHFFFKIFYAVFWKIMLTRNLSQTFTINIMSHHTMFQVGFLVVVVIVYICMTTTTLQKIIVHKISVTISRYLTWNIMFLL